MFEWGFSLLTHLCGVEDGGYEFSDNFASFCGATMQIGLGGGSEAADFLLRKAHSCVTNQ